MKNIIFDLDNTLIECGKYYLECYDRFAVETERRLGIPQEICKKVVKDIDVACTNLQHGFGKERFPRSFAAASAALDLISGNTLDLDMVELSYLLGESVFNAPYEEYPDAFKTVEAYSKSYKLFLWTKGDYEVQLKKITMHSLYRFFDRDKVYIVPKKDPEGLQQVLSDHNLTPSETIIVGDSIRDEIGSGNSLGLTTVWVKGNANSDWAYENEKHHPTYIIEAVKDLPTFIPIHSGDLVQI